MNDDRKFQERAETVKQLLLARIPQDIVAKVADVSESTVAIDRSRVAKLYGIKVPGANVTSLEREERFRTLLKAYLDVEFETYNRREPLYQAAKLLINFDKIENHIHSIESFFERIQKPRFTTENLSYQRLIEDCLSIKNCYFLWEFYHSIYSGEIPYEDIKNERDLIELATKFCCEKDRSSINTLVIEDSKEVVDLLFRSLTDTQIKVIRYSYGFDGDKMTLAEIGDMLCLSRERIRQIRKKTLEILRNKLDEKLYLVHSTAKINYLEKQTAELNERYNEYYKRTDQEILRLNTEIEKLKGRHEEHEEHKEHDVPFDENEYPLRIQILALTLKEVYLPIRIQNSLYGSYDCILDAVEDWDNLATCRCFGKKSYIALDDFLQYYGIDKDNLSLEDKVLARQLINRKKLMNS
jgi:DNA-binding CsgD family transcriptional regulator